MPPQIIWFWETRKSSVKYSWGGGNIPLFELGGLVVEGAPGELACSGVGRFGLVDVGVVLVYAAGGGGCVLGAAHAEGGRADAVRGIDDGEVEELVREAGHEVHAVAVVGYVHRSVSLLMIGSQRMSG